MSRLIPELDPQQDGSAQLMTFSGALARALAAPSAPPRTRLRAVPAPPEDDHAAQPGRGTGPGRADGSEERAGVVAPLRRDTPEPDPHPPIETSPSWWPGAGAGGAAEGIESGAPDLAAELWGRFLRDRARADRDALVVHYGRLVRGVAGRMAGGLPAHVDAADLVQSGMFGLMDAVERFDPDREVRFESYAAQRIRGAMLDELRAQDWVPRSVRGRRREIDRARERLELRVGRPVREHEVALELGIGLRELRAGGQHVQLVSVEALEDAAPHGAVPVADLLADDGAPDPLEVALRREAGRRLTDAVHALAERDRLVVRLYYVENLTLAEIGRVLGVTESRVCQLHARLLTRLRARLEEGVAG
ncbi:MAG: FliA/WhiG family RNA polymerase sigma factor [Pseudonocardia sp.]|nr:FliA/WhiG family RNA polymerase sigma factor [Pseudonocardia sp.]